ncbi:MAG: biotin--[acetyl-CoA-carboxylase] ligase [Flavobacteriaceae bacterium]|nr:biotin--[acetyl-CoA-carboxylase] ligase [Flavobacteriaceae bacterium]
MTKIIKLSATESTNSYLRELASKEPLDHFTVVTTDNQTQGRGQQGSSWQSEPGKNLTMSILMKDIPFLKLEPSLLSVAVSLAVFDTLSSFVIPDLAIKWPNDILSDHKKICGILIENIFPNKAIMNAIVGIGINVNQTAFDALPQASSLLVLTGRIFSVDEILQRLVKSLKDYHKLFLNNQKQTLISAYEAKLFRRNKPSTFKDKNGLLFTGIIQGITPDGKLRVMTENKLEKWFYHKEVTLLY